MAEEKVVNDPVHGHIKLHPLLVRIIDTPQFQRLRFIKQLGGASFVYPGATHTRFEHSIGVAHLAGQLAETLRRNQPELKITEEDVLCVKIAGLCHDLGHGPFSHLFDGVPEENWTHEDGSKDLFDHMVEKNNLQPEMTQYGLTLPEDLNFIKEMIHPNKDKENRKDKPFLFEIVANKESEIDVDKFDYFARDCHFLGIQNNFDHRRFLLFARVCDVIGKNGKKEKHICSRDKELHNLCNMFYTRSSLHRRAYKHKVVNNIQIMIADAFLKADKHKGLSKAIHDMEAYTKLTDQVFEDILYSSSNELMEARKILERIINRDLYWCLGQWKGEEPKPGQIDIWKGQIDIWKGQLAQGQDGLSKDDFEISFITIDYGMKDKNPMDTVYFYKKDEPNKATTASKEDLSMLLPATFSETTIVVYFKKSAKTDKPLVDKAQESFNTWRKG